MDLQNSLNKDILKGFKQWRREGWIRGTRIDRHGRPRSRQKKVKQLECRMFLLNRNGVCQNV